MRHLMRQRRENVLVGVAGERIGIERQLVHHAMLDPSGETIGRKVAPRLRLALQGHQDMRQRSDEQLSVEEIVRLLESSVFGGGDRLFYAFYRTIENELNKLKFVATLRNAALWRH
jgi:hypothetical protein